MTFQFAVIGGGFFGCAVALHLRRLGYSRVTLVERESQLLARASYRNQARIHNGYHYPRSYITASRCRQNLPDFRRDYGFAIKSDFVTLYAVAARRSKVTARQFERFMHEIGANYESAGSAYTSLFDLTRVAAVYIVEEYVFDACRLRKYFLNELAAANVDVKLATECTRIVPCVRNDLLQIDSRRGAEVSIIEAKSVINCTYANLNHTVRRDSAMTPLKHEVAEIALIDVPNQLADVGITVMDGSFFSCIPFPAERCHSLSHVRYTPHESSIDCYGTHDHIRQLDSQPSRTNVHCMIADAALIVPCLRLAQWRRSLFEIKTVLSRHEKDDGRPILLRREPAHPRLFSLLGAKIDNIYDILQYLGAVLKDFDKELCVPG